MTCGCEVIHRREALFCERCGKKLSEPMEITNRLAKTELFDFVLAAFKSETTLSLHDMLLYNEHLEYYGYSSRLRMTPYLSFAGYEGRAAIEMLERSSNSREIPHL
jgi:hypothetical protein